MREVIGEEKKHRVTRWLPLGEKIHLLARHKVIGCNRRLLVDQK